MIACFGRPAAAAREEKQRAKRTERTDTCLHIPHTTGSSPSVSAAWPKRLRSSERSPPLLRSRSRSASAPSSIARPSSAKANGSRLVTRLKFANLRQNATVEDLNTKAARGLDKALFAKLATGDWIGRRQDLLITGKTGTGKSWLACALGHKACRDDRSVLYHRVPRLLDALALARGDGRYVRLLKSLARVELLILDDWGLAPLTSQQGRDLLEIVDDRHGRGSTIMTSQLPVDHWHEVIVDPTIADAVLDRVVHTAHR
jgi:DNA replication protein DnaC